MKNIISIIIIIASIGIFFGYIKPQFTVIKERQDELKSYNDTLTQAEEMEKEIEVFSNKIASLNSEDMDKLEKLLPDTVSNVNLIIDINNIASNSGLTIRNIELEQPKTDGENKTEARSNSNLYDSIDLSFEVNASYASFQNFLRSLEKSLRLVDITAISFTPTDTTERYVFKVTLRTYWLK